MLPGIAHPVELYTLQQAGRNSGAHPHSGRRGDDAGGARSRRAAGRRRARLRRAGRLSRQPAVSGHPDRPLRQPHRARRVARRRSAYSSSPTNDGPNHLHGGPGGFHTVPWEVSAIGDGAEPSLALRYVSRDGEEGYPGTLEVEAVYTLTGERALRVDYTARTDRPTVVNLTQHSYFNLAGHAAGSILGHELRLWASRFLPIDRPRASRRARRGRCAGRRSISWRARRSARASPTDDEQLRNGTGYDHCFAVDGWDGSLRTIAEVVEPVSGRRMLVRTTEPGVQLYVGTHLGGIAGKRGARYARAPGFCLEAQHFPGLAAPPRISVDAPGAGRDLPPDDRVRVPRSRSRSAPNGAECDCRFCQVAAVRAPTRAAIRK